MSYGRAINTSRLGYWGFRQAKRMITLIRLHRSARLDYPSGLGFGGEGVWYKYFQCEKALFLRPKARLIRLSRYNIQEH